MNNANNHHSNKFMDGLILGLLIGGAAVFLLGTKKGKNILKIISEQGIDGLTGLLEEYDLAEVEDEEEDVENKTNGFVKKTEQVVDKASEVVGGLKENPVKKRFFKRIRR